MSAGVPLELPVNWETEESGLLALAGMDLIQAIGHLCCENGKGRGIVSLCLSLGWNMDALPLQEDVGWNSYALNFPCLLLGLGFGLEVIGCSGFAVVTCRSPHSSASTPL